MRHEVAFALQRFSGFGFRSENGRNSDFRGSCGEEFRSGSGMSEKTSLRRPVPVPPFVSRQSGNSQPRALFLPSAAKTRRARRNKLNAEESSLGLKAQPPFSELVVITLSLRS